MKDRKYHLGGLIGFIISGVIYTVNSIAQGDYMAVSGSLIWIVSCIFWMIPLIKRG